MRKRLLILGLGLLGVWLLFFDSHSLVRRAQWHHELTTMQAENEALQRAIDTLTVQLDAGVSDEVVEQIAREQYGMQRPGETVYRVQGPE